MNAINIGIVNLAKSLDKERYGGGGWKPSIWRMLVVIFAAPIPVDVLLIDFPIPWWGWYVLDAAIVIPALMLTVRWWMRPDDQGGDSNE